MLGQVKGDRKKLESGWGRGRELDTIDPPSPRQWDPREGPGGTLHMPAFPPNGTRPLMRHEWVVSLSA